MKCRKTKFEINDLVYFVIVMGENTYVPRFKIVKKTETIEGVYYTIDFIREQEDNRVVELLKRKQLGGLRDICGESIFEDKEDAIRKASNYYAKLHYNILLLGKSEGGEKIIKLEEKV